MIGAGLRRWKLAWLATGLLGLLGLVALRVWTPTGISTCLSYWLLGVPCPGCGMTRASALLARGEIVASLRLHPLALAFAAQAAIAWIWWGLVLFGRARKPSPWWGIVPLSLDLALLLGIWLVRYGTGTLPR